MSATIDCGVAGIIERGEENCRELIEAHKECMRTVNGTDGFGGLLPVLVTNERESLRLTQYSRHSSKGAEEVLQVLVLNLFGKILLASSLLRALVIVSPLLLPPSLMFGGTYLAGFPFSSICTANQWVTQSVNQSYIRNNHHNQRIVYLSSST
ncbi:unnamed protein product [Oppiella nova]|uniref:Uncharacterized protein n=1 Tax=Oppiella nova TaxID=334625 RepID=A0A7R9QB74_9ACAR|nr:unnamed protein product [Oppiella nova]CAG2161220.1 unnamed protein product [Oppiella nova]